jgi:uncharacterized membrane protein YkoI
MQTLLNTALAGTLIAATGLACAAEYTPELDRVVDSCIEAALNKHPGQVLQWDLDSRADVTSTSLEVVTTEDLVWTIKCEAGAIVSDERRMGNKNYKMLTSRMKVPESTCRQAAVAEYPGTDLTRMRYELNWRGTPSFNYTFQTRDGRDATVEVSAGTGRIERTHSTRTD